MSFGNEREFIDHLQAKERGIKGMEERGLEMRELTEKVFNLERLILAYQKQYGLSKEKAIIAIRSDLLNLMKGGLRG